MSTAGDYGLPLRFGVFPTPDVSVLGQVLELARVADENGLDLLGVQDHPYRPRHLDSWTLLTVIAARTRRVRVFPDVANLPLRQPAMLARAAASLDVISSGRVELGLGAGAYWAEIGAMGGPVRERVAAVTALEEAISVVRLMWSDAESVHFTGAHYRLDGVRPGPRPAHPIGIWVGALGPRMLALTGRLADGWIASLSHVPPHLLAERHARIDDAAVAAGRHPASIRRIYNLYGEITDGESRGTLQGPVDQWIDELTGYAVEHGVDTFLFGPAADPVNQVRRFALEVVPAVREAVAVHRAGVDA